MFIPCKNFKFGNNESTLNDAFLKHYGKCAKCEIYNNNNIELYLDKNRIIYKKYRNGDKLKNIIELYTKLKKNIYEIKKKNGVIQKSIKIIRVDDEKNIYNNCLFILW